LNSSPLAIRGLGALSALGNDMAAHRAAMLSRTPALRPLGGLLGAEHPLAALPAGWIEPRAMLAHRKWAPFTIAAMHAAREAADDAGWTREMLADAALVFASSRGNAAGWVDPWPGRRPFPVMAASNSMTAEPATAITIELGIKGPCHVLSTGCSAGIDALGIASLILSARAAPRAMVVAVDLPLAPRILDAYHHSGMLSTNGLNDPYSRNSSGMLPAEGAAAIAVEPANDTSNNPLFLGHISNSDAENPIGMPPDGAPIARLLTMATRQFGTPAAVCPHAGGTPTLATAEPAAMLSAFPEPPPLIILKPLAGHCIAAAALLESVMIADSLRNHRLAPSPKGLTPPESIPLISTPQPARGPVFKLASGLGGHNSLAAFAPPATG
jgi:3-oxoacyl-[acyl-carrier-protein] synthase II